MNYISTSNPLARIAVDKNELRVYDNGEIYLKDGTEFQIMLMNPTSDTILAKVKLNNKDIGNHNASGLILRPGERVWLERYFDDNKKFKFETYLADNSDAGKAAIAFNGFVSIDFYKEEQQTSIRDYQIYYGNTLNLDNSGGYVGQTLTTDVPNFDFTSTSNFVCSDSNLKTPMPKKSMKKSIKRLLLDSVETGRIEKGSKSDQEFQSSTKDFQSFPFHSVEYKLFPLSQKTFVSSKDLKRYCDNCGKRVRNDKAKFCSACGNKL